MNIDNNARALGRKSWKIRKEKEGNQWKDNLKSAAKKGGESLAKSRGKDYYSDLAKRSREARLKRKQEEAQNSTN